MQPSSEHRFTFGLQTDPATVANSYQGSPFIKAEAQGHQAQGGYFTNGRWQWFLSPDLNLDTVATFQKINIRTSSVPCTHDSGSDSRRCRPDEEEGFIDWYTPGRVGRGGAFDSVNNIRFSFNDRNRLEVSTKLSWTNVRDPLGGTHDSGSEDADDEGSGGDDHGDVDNDDGDDVYATAAAVATAAAANYHRDEDEEQKARDAAVV